MKELVVKANEVALSRMQDAKPEWVDVLPAVDAIGLEKETLLHSGPPISWERMCGPMRGAVIAVLQYEGLADSPKTAEQLAESGHIKFEPCHHYDAVGPMTGITSASMPLLCVRNTANGNVAFSTLNEGAGDVIRFGAYSSNTINRLHWIENVLGPALKRTVRFLGELDLNSLISQALNMGDELHMRNNASTSLFIKSIIPALTETTHNLTQLKEIVQFLTNNNDQFFLNFAMAAQKASADSAHGIEYSTIVTAIARNGVDIGIRVSGLGNTWFTAPAADVQGLYFSGFSSEDANRDIGDSAIMETGGLGGFAIAAAPAIVRLLGAESYETALSYNEEMYEISFSRSKHYFIPNLNFQGTPIGIDIAKVVETNIQPIINTAIASKKAGVGMIGAGIARVPIEVFQQALFAYAQKYNL